MTITDLSDPVGHREPIELGSAKFKKVQGNSRPLFVKERSNKFSAGSWLPMSTSCKYQKVQGKMVFLFSHKIKASNIASRVAHCRRQ